MQTMAFTVSVGAKRQVTIPRQMMDCLAIEEGSQIRLEVSGGRGTLTPLVSVPREALSPALRAKFLSRRGAKDSDLSLNEFLKGSARRSGAKQVPAAAKRRKA
jgi:bifunctional DNA-binding transcriptional regulator/antitoxin component of YhaV-PrlF toxin-antitoxin module